MMTQFAMAAGGMGALGGEGAATAVAPSNEPASAGPMTEEEARAIVAKAAAQGKLSEEQAQELLQGEAHATGTDSSSEEKSKGIGKLWKNITGNKQS
jgi:hypothetical protein